MTNTTAPVNPSEVGWQFVPQYYTFVNKHPNRLHCFYTKTSTFIHGTEGEEGKPCYGQAEIHAKITSIGFQDCKVFIHSVDAQSSANGGIIIQVIGEMSNHGEPWRKFVQTFFLAEQPNGYFVLNDIFRFLKEDTVEDDQASDSETAVSQDVPAPLTMPVPEPATAPKAPPMPTPAPAPPVVEPEPEAVREPTPPPVSVPEVEQPPAPEPEPEPEAQTNGVHEPEPEPVPEPPSPVQPTPESVATASPPPTSPETLAPPTAPSPAPPAPQPQQQPPPPHPVPVAAPAPAPPAVPPQQKTWANLAAANHNKWGAVAQEAKGISEVPVTSSSPAPSSASQAPQRPPPQRSEAYTTAISVSNTACYVKNVTENVTDNALRATLTQRFGPIKELEITRNKGCAFLEFERVESARRAIVASLHTSQGGEGGVRIGQSQDGGIVPRVFVETRKEKSERAAARGGAPNGGDSRRGGYRGGRGGYGGRGGRGGSGAPPK